MTSELEGPENENPLSPVKIVPYGRVVELTIDLANHTPPNRACYSSLARTASFWQKN
jgi:hypothetical protein